MTYKETSSAITQTSANLGTDFPKRYNPLSLTVLSEADSNLKRVRPVSLTWTCTTTSSQWANGQVIATGNDGFSGTVSNTSESYYVSKSKGVTSSVVFSNLQFRRYWFFANMASGWASGTQTFAGTITNIVWEVENGGIIKTGALCHAGIPDHSHQYMLGANDKASGTDHSCMKTNLTRVVSTMTPAAASNDIYGNSVTVRPESLGTQYLIKY